MCRVLILDDDKRYAEALKPVVEGFESGETITDTASTLDEALGCAQKAALCGQPYTVFIVDQRLGTGKDGIEAMKELKAASPDSDAIILTGVGDLDVGVRAYQAGAFRYLSKPVEEEELTFVLNSLMQSRREVVENKWRKVFSVMVETALHKTNFAEVAKVVAEYSLQLGFARAHILWSPKRSGTNLRNILGGVECAGDDSIKDFSSKKLTDSLAKEFWQILQTRDATFIPGKDINKKLNSEMASIGFSFPKNGLWVLPLWSGTEMLGALTLDFCQEQHFLGAQERSLLNFFSRQVAVTLEHAELYDAEKRALQEAEMFSHIGRQTGTRAATQNLTKLLEQIRVEVGKQFEVSDFSIFIHKEQENTISFELLYENGSLQNKLPRVAGNGLEEYMLAQKNTVTINDVRSFIKEKGIKLQGSIPFAWLGAPLQVGEKIIGGVCIQKREKGSAFSDHDKQILRSVADQVAGAVQISDFKKEEDEDRERMQLLQRASVEMLRIARQNEDSFWLSVLTLATANFGLGFNRALLFLTKDNREILQGRAGIGTNSAKVAVRHWKREEKLKNDLNSFLNDVDAGKIRLTQFHKMISGMDISLSELGAETREILESIRVLKVKKEELLNHLPEAVIQKFELSDCALLSIGTGNFISGLVIVDNKHNQKPLNDKILSSLQSLLANAGLVWETLRQREKSEDLLDANLEILGSASHQSLQKTLDRICRTAHLISRADWTIIHPFKSGKKPFEIDVKNVGHYGELNSSILDLTKSKLQIGGVSRHVLKKGELVVGNIDKRSSGVGKLKLSESHFIQSEGVKALIGVAIKNPSSTEELLGILYLDYRQPREFSKSDVHHAESLASLAAVAISNMHELEEIKQRRQFKLAKEIAEAVGASLDLETTMNAILSKLHEAFGKTRLCVLLYDKHLQALKFAPGTSKFYKVNNPKYIGQDTFPLEKVTIACRVARKTLSKKKVQSENVDDVSGDAEYLILNPEVKSEFCISLLSTKNELLGVMALERKKVNGFGDDDIEVIKAVAQHISIAIERAQQSEDLEYNSTVAAQTSWAANLAHEVNNEVGKILNWAYFIRKIASENPEIQGYARNIEESATKLSSTNPWTGKPPTVVEIDAILKSYLEQITLLRSIEVKYDLCAPEAKVLVKTAQFQHVLRQLVNNASRAMDELEKKKILVSTRLKNNSMVEILFEDFGPGLSEEKHLFAFRRRFTTKETGGYGLLFIRQMIEDMLGEIVLRPYQKGKGAAFLIQLPIHKPTQNRSN